MKPTRNSLIALAAALFASEASGSSGGTPHALKVEAPPPTTRDYALAMIGSLSPYGDNFPGHGSRAYKMIKRNGEKRYRKGLATTSRHKCRRRPTTTP